MKYRFGRFSRILGRSKGGAQALFDREFYLRTNGDVRLSGIEPWLHYRRHGSKEGRKPNHIFDPKWYLEHYPDVKRSGIEPLQHYCMHGFLEGRDPGPTFSTRGYLAMNLDVAASRVNPLFHYLQFGKKEGREAVLAAGLRNSVAPIVNGSLFRAAYTEDETAIISASGLFDNDFYVSAYPELGVSNAESVGHFCAQGWKEGRWPNPSFDVPYYLKQNPDVAALGMNPLVHWIKFGRAEGRKIGAVRLLSAEGSSGGKEGPTVIFLSHESSQTGAPRVLLNLIEWIAQNTEISFRIVIGSRGPWSHKFEALGDCFHLDGDHGGAFDRKLRDFCGNKVGLIYANTIAAGHYIHHFDFLDAEVLTHVHEMEHLFQLYKDSFSALKERTNQYIAVSGASVTALTHRGVSADCINLLPPFVTPSSPNRLVDNLRGTRVIIGCGTVEGRKGFDIFCDVGAALRRITSVDFQMYWIGSASDSVPDPELEISKRGINDVVTWLGAKDAPSDYFRQAHIFLLPSREDPFPLVCLEAAQVGIPVVCFDERAGGMHRFVQRDAGIVVDYLDIEQMAAKVGILLEDNALRAALGSRAMDKALSLYSVENVAQEIVSLFPDFTRKENASWLDLALRRIDGAEIVSFDIFDTLITRRVSQPEVVFDLVEFRHTRQEAAPVRLLPERMESAGRVLMSHEGRIDDVDIDQIYAEMAFFKDPEIEKEIEVAVSIAHPTGKILYNHAKNLQKKIFFASDMYLDAGTIETILRKHGFSHWDRLFISSVTGKKKESGRMYDLLKTTANESGVAPGRVIHFGDNRHSDVEMARRAGFKACHFPALYEERPSVLNQNAGSLSQIGRLWASFSDQSLKLWRKTPIGSTAPFFTRLGFEVTGPLAAMMALFVKQAADETGVSEIVFMARDGRIIKDAFDEIFKDEISSRKYESHYLHLSRATVVPATFERKLSSNDVYFLLEGLHLGIKPISYFLNKAGLDPKDRIVVSKVKEYFPGPDFVPSWIHLSDAAKLMRGLSELIFPAFASHRELLRDYLQQNGLLNAGKFLVVDVGWLLNIQTRLERFVAEIGSDVAVSGCYVGSRDRVSKNAKHRSFLFDCGDPSHYAAFVETHTTLFELLFSAPEPSANGLARNSAGEIQPILKAVSHPPSGEYAASLELQFGARCYFDYLSGAFKDFLPQQVSRDYFFGLFERLVTTDNPLAHAMLNGLEVKLGGHHEFPQVQKLLPGSLDVEYTLVPSGEYFVPKVLPGDGLRHVVIVTAAGLSNASTRYRALWLAESLNKAGYQTTVIHSSTPVDVAERFISKCSAVVFQRCFESQGNVAAFYGSAKRHGLYCIGEMDDLILPDQIAIVGSVKGGEWDTKEAKFVAQSYDEFMQKMDGFVVSTPALSRVFKRRYKKSTVIYRNKLPNRYIREPERSFDKLKMLYASGTRSHKADFATIEDVLYRLLVERPDVRLTLLGAVQSSERLLALPNVRSLPLLQYDAMMNELINHNVLLVPLEDTPFNECKSSVKFVESGAVSVPVIASKVSEFDLAISHGNNGYLAEGADDWYEILIRLANDPSILVESGNEARRFVATRCTTDFVEPELDDFFRGMTRSVC